MDEEDASENLDQKETPTNKLNDDEYPKKCYEVNK